MEEKKYWTDYEHFKLKVHDCPGHNVVIEVLEDPASFYYQNRLWRPYVSRWFHFDSVQELKSFINACVVAVREYEKDKESNQLSGTHGESSQQLSQIVGSSEKEQSDAHG